MIGAITAGLLGGAGAPASSTSYESIATVNVGILGASSIDFTSIPSTYKHLEVRAIMRTNRVNAGDAVYVRVNSVSSAAYSGHRLEGNGSSASSTGAANETSITLNRVSAVNDAANVFGAAVVQVLDYADTNKNKTLRALVGYDTNSDGVIGFDSGAWYNTSAITSLSILPLNATGFVQYSSFALYGIRG
jgi:hypothetical protein